MALLSRIYYNAVFGALGGLLGWMLYGVLGDKSPPPTLELFGITFSAFLLPGLLGQTIHVQSFLGGAIIGGAIGYLVVSVEAIRDRSLVRFSRLASYGVILGAIGGAIGMALGDLMNYRFLELMGDHLLVVMLARGLGWTFLGITIGMSEGIAARSLGRFSYSTIGGALGGFIGGCLFGLFYALIAREHSTTYFWGAVGLVILGACIGSLSALVQGVMQPASVKVLRGWQEGREYPLDKLANLLGRDEHADIALFRDMKIEKQHCYIKRLGNRFVLFNNNAPAQHTLVNDAPVAGACDLYDGDRLQLGNVVLKFQMKAAVHTGRRGAKPIPVTK